MADLWNIKERFTPDYRQFGNGGLDRNDKCNENYLQSGKI